MPGTRKLGKTTDQRMAMLRQQVTDLLDNGKMETTVTRAKEIKPLAEKMITLGKKGDLAAYRQANWSVDTEDWRTKDSGKILDVIYRCTGDGDIVLLHDRYQNTVDAVLMAIGHLQEQGYVFVTVAELLALKGVAAEPGVTYRGGHGENHPRSDASG